MSKIANPKLAQAISDGIVKPAKDIKPKKGNMATSEGNTVASLDGSTAKERIETKALEHIEHQYNKDAKIQKQACMKAAASVYKPTSKQSIDTIAKNVIAIAEKLYEWVNLK